jgi:hypothetical protein
MCETHNTIWRTPVCARNKKFWEELICLFSLNPNKISSKSINRFKSCAHLSSLNVRHFGTVEATALSSMESRSSSMSSPPYKISSSCTNRFKSSAHLSTLNVSHFGMAEDARLKCGIEVYFDGVTFLQNFMKILRSVQKLLVEDTQTHTRTDTDKLVIW